MEMSTKSWEKWEYMGIYLQYLKIVIFYLLFLDHFGQAPWLSPRLIGSSKAQLQPFAGGGTYGSNMRVFSGLFWWKIYEKHQETYGFYILLSYEWLWYVMI